MRASRGTVLLPDMTLDEALESEFDMIALPGGLPGADHLAADARIIQTLQKMAAAGKYTCAICAAPRVLAKGPPSPCARWASRSTTGSANLTRSERRS